MCKLGCCLQAVAGWGLTPAQLAAAAGGGALVLYALVAERRAVGRALRRAAGGVGASVGELARLALSVSPNPVAAAAASRVVPPMR